MTHIQELVDKIEEELEGAKEYAEDYLTCKASGNSVATNKYKEMAQDELKHADIIHERAVQEINKLQTVYTPPVEMEEAWQNSHRKYIEREAWIRQMLTM